MVEIAGTSSMCGEPGTSATGGPEPSARAAVQVSAMISVCADRLVETLQRHELLPPEQAAQLPSVAERCLDRRVLAQELIRRGWLTPYQVNQIFLGREADLRLGKYVLLERLGEG